MVLDSSILRTRVESGVLVEVLILLYFQSSVLPVSANAVKCKNRVNLTQIKNKSNKDFETKADEWKFIEIDKGLIELY